MRCVDIIGMCFPATIFDYRFELTIHKNTLRLPSVSDLDNDITDLSAEYEKLFELLYDGKEIKKDDFVYDHYNEDENAFKYSTNFTIAKKMFDDGAINATKKYIKKDEIVVILKFSNSLITPTNMVLAKFLWIVNRCIKDNWSKLQQIYDLIESYRQINLEDTRIYQLELFLSFLNLAKEKKKLKRADQIIRYIILSYLKHYNVSKEDYIKFEKLDFYKIFECSEEVLDVLKELNFDDLIGKFFTASEQAFFKFCE